MIDILLIICVLALLDALHEIKHKRDIARMNDERWLHDSSYRNMGPHRYNKGDV